MSTTRKLHPLEAAALGRDADDLSTGPIPGRVESMLPHLKDEREAPAEIMNEKPWHRSAAYMMLRGVSQKVVAKHFDVHPTYISRLRKQEWFKRVCEQLADIHFGGDLFGLLEGAAFDAVQTLNDLAVGAESESVRRASASDLLDKYLKHRKPTENKVSDNPQQELEQLDEEIQRLESEEVNHKLI